MLCWTAYWQFECAYDKIEGISKNKVDCIVDFEDTDDLCC